MSKILVIGDSCNDIFTYGYCKRLSPEAPVPILNPITTITGEGMSYNVYNNIKALGADCDIITNFDRPQKTRYVDEVSNQTLLRVDENDEVYEIDRLTFDKIEYENYDAIVISDYNKGYLTEDDIEYISVNHKLVFLDSKKPLGDWCRNVDVIKINEKEHNKSLKWITESYKNDLVVTLGCRGSMLNGELFPIEKEHPVRDLSGAGDTYLAALVVKFLNSNDMKKAIKFANLCSAWVVTQKGVTVVDLNKMKEW
jgi:bifunctional ADP-heptose synthase (sugar kinase/adenylyltransferase)